MPDADAAALLQYIRGELLAEPYPDLSPTTRLNQSEGARAAALRRHFALHPAGDHLANPFWVELRELADAQDGPRRRKRLPKPPMAGYPGLEGFVRRRPILRGDVELPAYPLVGMAASEVQVLQPARSRVVATATLVAVPALDEADRIATVVERVLASVPHTDVVVVDDGSRDGTIEEARRAGATVVRHPFNLGYGAALQTAYKYAARRGYRYLVQLDADGQHDPADVPRLLAPLERDEADVVIGSRFASPAGYHMSPGRRLGRWVFGTLLRLLGGPHVADPTSGFQALSRTAFTLGCGDFFPADFPDVDVLLFLCRQGLRLVEVPVAMAPNPAGHRSMHAGMHALYYPYKMCLALFRAFAVPRPTGYGLRHGPSAH